MLAFCLNNLFGQISIGGKIGYLHSNTAKELGTRAYDGINGGIVALYKLSKTISLKGELIYSTRGYEISEGVLDEGILKNVKVKFEYLDIPFFIEYNTSPFLSIYAGPFFGLQIKRKLYYNDLRQDGSVFGEKQIFDSGVILGIKAKIKNLFLETQYQYGFTQSYKNVDAFKTKAFSVNLGYMFNLK
jgi:hypothetical protein